MTTATRIDAPPDISDPLLDAPHHSRLRGSHPAPAPTEGTLKVEDLAVTFRSKRRAVEAVRGISFTVEAGKTLVLLGESGSGKSVSARAVMRLYSDAVDITGRATLGGVDLFGLDERAMQSLRGRDIALVPQDASGSLDPLRRVGSQIAEVLRRHGIEHGRKAARQRSGDLLAQVGIPDPARAVRSYPHELSGGMRQRALIAIAIACQPRVLVADEPTTALDMTIQAQVLDLFAQLQADLGMGLLLVTHDVGVASQMADQVAVMYAGRLVEDGPGATVLGQPAHPYTAGLLRAVPTPETPRGQLRAIPGQPPASGQAVDEGCSFAPRCVFAVDECRTDRPPLLPVGTAHWAACPVVDGLVPVDVGPPPDVVEAS
ncbi:MAG TPA: ABC transporter ATP-binding protein [Acidimicrobiales bacterium]|nr:ABC transporter ATP-binding protein [Acidimicrobiales bacterium]